QPAAPHRARVRGRAAPRRQDAGPVDAGPEEGSAVTAELLRVEDLRVEYLTAAGRVRVVDDVSFTLRRGEVLGLAGESGSGKTTIALAILRLLKAPAAITGGRVLFEGRDLLDLGEIELRRMRGRRIA